MIITSIHTSESVGRLLAALVAVPLFAGVAVSRGNDGDVGGAKLPRITVNEAGNGFVQEGDGAPFIAWGFNYDHDERGRLIEDYWLTDWAAVVEDFHEMKRMGASVARVHLQTGKFLEGPNRANPTAVGQFEKLCELAQEAGVYLNVTGLGCYHKQETPGWYDSLDEQDRWEAQAFFWKTIAEVGARSSAIFCYDLMNEPILPGAERADEWVTGELGGKSFVQRIALELKGRSREEVAKAWVAKLASAIREKDQRRMITVGVIPWAHVWPNAKPLFHSEEVGAPLDFVSVHFYPKKGEVRKAIEALKVYEIGKPLVVEEMFPLHCSGDEMEEFMRETRGIVDGWISFYWGRTAEEYRQDKDLRGALIADWLERFEAARQGSGGF